MANVLASVTDKTHLVEFAKTISSGTKDVKFIASGGTATELQNGGINVVAVSDITKSNEMLAGRVKTLHPNIHGGILARNSEKDLNEIKKLGIEAIDIVICNLYEFEKTIGTKGVSEAECIEQIDIGGVALLRAAAKNFDRVTVICDTQDYDLVAKEFLSESGISLETRKRLAVKAFALCTKYDAAITNYLSGGSFFANCGYKLQDLRYGENPHQSATLYTNEPNAGVLNGTLLQGKELSYNNILDCDAAWKAVSLFEEPAAVVVKHLTPCGIAKLSSKASEKDLHKAIKAAIACDSVSAFGSIIAVNRTFDVPDLEAFGNLFVECLIAPSFTPEVKTLLAAKKNWRVIENPASVTTGKKELRSVLGGFLVQDVDLGDPSTVEYKPLTTREPSPLETELLMFAWKACLPIKSNAIVLAAPIDETNVDLGFCTVGIGCGQPNRVDAARHAIERAGEKVKASVLASDAFFPFADTVELAIKAGVKAIVQPGGSIRDSESIEACNKANIAMLGTGVRHFKH